MLKVSRALLGILAGFILAEAEVRAERKFWGAMDGSWNLGQWEAFQKDQFLSRERTVSIIRW